jgi:SAM-dependent methyltransferase
MAGDFGQIAVYTESEARRFISRLKIPPGAQVLDVACGTGNLSIAAAQLEARVRGLDIAPNLIEQARSRAGSAGLKIQFDEGDAEELPYQDESFDFVLSMYGAMFAPRAERVAEELIRVCRPGGVIAMANWTNEGFIGQMLKLITVRTSSAPSGAASPAAWGDEEKVRERFVDGVSALRLERRIHDLKLPFSVIETVEFFRLYYGPLYRTFATLDGDDRATLRLELEHLWSKYNRATNGSTQVEAEYLEVVARR